MRNYPSITAIAIAGLLSASWTQASSIFVNEIHYDNTGTDTGDAIEIAGPPGSDLSGCSLVLYNGSGGAVYDTRALSGTIPNQVNGFGTLSITFPTNGIQNRSPDGVALVDNSASVVQFLSYEGIFTAVGGPANGQTSTDIGVTEGSPTPVGYSLQLGGTGTVSTDFTWQSAMAQTFGSVNTNQFFFTDTGLVINEVDYDQPGTDNAEFIELMNTGNSPVDLSQFSLDFLNGATNTSYQRVPLPTVMLGSGKYFVICGDAAEVVNCDFSAGVATNFIQTFAADNSHLHRKAAQAHGPQAAATGAGSQAMETPTDAAAVPGPAWGRQGLSHE